MATWLCGQLLFLLTFLTPSSAISQPSAASDMPPVVCQFELFELQVAGADTSTDSFNSRTTPLATFSLDNTPNRNVSVRAFLFQNYTRSWDGVAEQLHTLGDPTFLIRFAPPTPGRWTWTVRNHTNAILSRGALQAVACSGGSRPADGFVRVSASGQHFVLSNSGRGIFPVRRPGSGSAIHPSR